MKRRRLRPLLATPQPAYNPSTASRQKLRTSLIQRLIGAGFDLSGLFCVSRDAGLRVAEFDCVMVRSSTS